MYEILAHRLNPINLTMDIHHVIADMISFFFIGIEVPEKVLMMLLYCLTELGSMSSFTGLKKIIDQI